MRPPVDGVDSVELEEEESLDPEACFTEGEAQEKMGRVGGRSRRYSVLVLHTAE